MFFVLTGLLSIVLLIFIGKKNKRAQLKKEARTRGETEEARSLDGNIKV